MLQKGGHDIIATDTSGADDNAAHEASKISKDDPEESEVIVVDTPGGLKRCGGQGDILSGSVGAFLAWGTYSMSVKHGRITKIDTHLDADGYAPRRLR